MKRALLLPWILLAACGGEAPPVDEPVAASIQPPPVEIALNWFPEAEHGGFFAAVAHGLDRDQGVRFELLPGGPGVPVVPRVASGDVAFGVANADLVALGRASGAPVVALMAGLQHSPRCIMVHAESGIGSLAELRDVDLAMSPKGAFSHFLRRELPLEGVEIVPYTGSVAPFLREPRLAQQAYAISEPFVARSAGADPRCLMVSELGWDPYTSLLVTSERLVAEQPDLVRAVVAAAVAGWARYLDDPVATNDLIHERNPEMGLDILEYGVEAIRPLVRDATTETGGLGTMSLERWTRLVEQLETLELVEPGRVVPTETFTGAFLAPG